MLDLRHYDKPHEHGYALSGFDLPDLKYAPGLLPPLPKKQPFAYAFSRLTKRFPLLHRENGLAYDPQIAKSTDPVWLEGYFQSVKYFEEHLDLIRADLTPKSEPDAENLKWLTEIQNEPLAVSLHVRRGDYVRNEKFAAQHGTCTSEYYRKSLSRIIEQTGAEPVLYVFSDDPEWVRSNLKLPARMKVLGHNDASKNIEDLRLMSACRHHIIANSSFSWWGAMLNPRSDKVVVTPSKWFADPITKNPDIWPDDWLRVDG